jgi:phosphoribosylformimino-5-aminoimidazole carboxamide ribotide isomerase
MRLILAMDLQQNMVVHGMAGRRSEYRPLDWGLSPTADPAGFVRAIRPRFIYMADLDRIEGTGSHDETVRECARIVDCCCIDRGCRSPLDLLDGDHIINIVGTETGGSDLSGYHNCYLSVDVKDGRVIPSGGDPVAFLESAQDLDFSGCILLNISGVGTGSGIPPANLAEMRQAYDGQLLYGGGVASADDLSVINDAGFDGAIVATALHKGKIPVEWIRRGSVC